jgi:hypothetical protein
MKVSMREIKSRRTDSTGRPIYHQDKFLLKHKRLNKYYSGGSLHAPHLEKDEGMAIIFDGGKLNDLAYDWTLDWKAVRYEE